MKFFFVLLCAFLLIVGCAEEKNSFDAVPALAHEMELKNSQLVGGAVFRMPDGAADKTVSFRYLADTQQSPKDSKPNTLIRKIIYNADVHLIVDNFETGEAQLKRLITQYNGQIANSDQRGQSGSQRTGHWKVRIPVENFDAFKAAVEKVGNLERSSINSSDVTEEFYDIEARLKNKKVEETRLLAHLEKSTAKLSDILDVEKELSRVRSEIEQMQGKLNLLMNLTSLTTVDINIREVKNYIPPTAPTFGDDVSRTLSNSWSMLVRTGRNVSLNLISILPWLPLWIIVALICYRPLRWLLRKMRTTSKPNTEPTPATT